MKYFFIALTSLLLVVSSCSSDMDSTQPVHAEMNSVYYWKTVLELDSTNLSFLSDHHVGRIYLRMFDVVDNGVESLNRRTVPNASVRVGQDEYNMLNESLTSIEVVPVVYVTLDALKRMRVSRRYTPFYNAKPEQTATTTTNLSAPLRCAKRIMNARYPICHA